MSNIFFEVANETKFNKKAISQPIHKKIFHGFKSEYKYFKGWPKSLKINDPKKHKTTRDEIESLLIPYLKNDILLLESLGYNIEKWETFKKMSN